MLLIRLLPLLALRSISVVACGREHLYSQVFDPHVALSKRQEASFPPVLDQNEAILLNSIDNNTIESWSYYYTHGLHVAGTNQSMAQWTADRWNEYGFTADLVSYYVYLNYPVSHSLTISFANGSSFTPLLEEEVLAQDETTSYPNRVPTFHGYSFTGDAEAEYVYVGRGQRVDFERLKALGVQLEGKIALARYGGPFRGLKVKNAQDYGMIGCIIFTDTADDGNITEANGYAAYPDGPARNPTSVQRGSVEFLSTYPGDPETPGYPSKLDSPRSDRSAVTPQIPSLPISWKDAQPLIQALDGYGPDGKTINRTNWIGKLNATYSSGPAPGTTISMSNVMRDEITWIWDSIGIINGTNEDEVIILGNHRDAWIVGGASDPNSGSAVLIEMAKAFGALLKTGWRPKRTIVFASWDAEEYGLLGSTEWVEEYIPWLKGSAVAYLNLDGAASGPNPELSASPELHKIATETMKKVVYPYHGYKNLTYYDVWYGLSKGTVGVLGSGSDYTAFVHNGIASLDTGCGGGSNDPVYHYHSNYDSFHWMTTYGDPDFLAHKAVGQHLSLLVYHLANDDIIPFDVENYGLQMTRYLDQLTELIESENATAMVDLSPLETAISAFNSSAEAMASFIQAASTESDIKLANTKLRDFSRGFVSQGGLPTREFYKHVVFAPGLDTGYAPVEWPGVTEAIDAGNLTLAQLWVEKSAKAVEVAARILAP
ncbi:Transferrin receptor-like dimerization domain-containing protein [Cladophialophora immunda]|nr:Transferrin receptor-like dimerization domain-containing protein [Cladophialophora immunda]